MSKEIEKIEIGDVVRFVERPERVGVVESIIDYGTHVAYFVNIGKPIKYPCRREWIELVEKGDTK